MSKRRPKIYGSPIMPVGDYGPGQAGGHVRHIEKVPPGYNSKVPVVLGFRNDGQGGLWRTTWKPWVVR